MPDFAKDIFIENTDLTREELDAMEQTALTETDFEGKCATPECRNLQQIDDLCAVCAVAKLSGDKQ